MKTPGRVGNIKFFTQSYVDALVELVGSEGYGKIDFLKSVSKRCTEIGVGWWMR